MTFEEAVKEVLLRIKLDSADVRNRVKAFMNDSIDDFMDLREWTFLKFKFILTLDGSDTYDLKNLTSTANPIYKFKKVVNENGSSGSGAKGFHKPLQGIRLTSRTA
ncbi:hypothetical protein LCGC14_2493040 [marine sediment metagenome]|uniref:Uncharacterized protein n=1 Tax=marine sediment metagenome TaxID=412755 RepID=A0A0F9B4Y1_9ZZZZ